MKYPRAIQVIIDRLGAMSEAPVEPKAFNAWLEQEDSLSVLRENSREQDCVVYASFGHVYINAVTVPEERVVKPDADDLLHWNFSPSSGWGISHNLVDPDSIALAPPLDHTFSRTIDGGEQLVFTRFFEGHIGPKNYIEILQKFTQAMGLHYVGERSAFCRLDHLGDYDDVIRIINASDAGTIVTVRRDVLDEWLLVTRSVIIRVFDFTRFRPKEFDGWTNGEPILTSERDLYYRGSIQKGHAGYIRGCQIVRPASTRSGLLKKYTSWRGEGREYASFIVHDWKNRRVCEVSSAPGATANYFTQSDLPFETSPAFFRPEVLVKYKSDPEKYRLGDRTLSCRGAWDLQTFDVNEEGQVHTYIVYLRNLPYEEQMHWKAYNERPKGPISKRAFTTDFEGSWDVDYDPLNSIKALVAEWEPKGTPWWTCRSSDLSDRCHYPVTPSAEEWANELMNLDKLLVEGFEEKWLRTTATELKLASDAQARSLGLLELCLVGKGVETEDARGLIVPLRELHRLRSKLKGHAAGEEANTIRQDTLREHGDYATHYRKLTEKCDRSLRAIESVLVKK